MQTLDLTIGGRIYRLGVPTAEANRLTQLAARVDAIVTDVRDAEPLIERDRQLVLTCLQLAADLAAAQQQLDDQQGAVARFHRHLAERLEILLP